MADQEIKQKPQDASRQQNPLERKDAAAEQKSESRNILQETRVSSNIQNSQQLALNALLNRVGTATDPQVKTNTSTNNRPGTVRSGRQARESRQDPRKNQANESSAELREQIANRVATTQRNVATATAGRAVQNASAGTVADLRQDTQTTDTESSLQHSGMTETIKSPLESSNSLSPDPSQNRGQQEISAKEALNNTQLNPSAETVKLLDLVGPEAVLTFREKLQQVWVTLDANAVKDLDVVARMPATMTGMSAMELLMVESPQGIHFVAFLKNSNDFDVLATFDRRALLPDSPSRQLIEAALMSYEQMDTVFKEGGNRIENKVKELASTKGTSDIVFQELQRLMVQEKRRRRKFRGMIDYLIDRLDEMDLEEDPSESPFVPKDLEKDQSGIGQGRLESELMQEEEIQAGVKPEDNDYH